MNSQADVITDEQLRELAYANSIISFELKQLTLLASAKESQVKKLNGRGRSRVYHARFKVWVQARRDEGRPSDPYYGFRRYAKVKEGILSRKDIYTEAGITRESLRNREIANELHELEQEELIPNGILHNIEHSNELDRDGVKRRQLLADSAKVSSQLADKNAILQEKKSKENADKERIKQMKAQITELMAELEAKNQAQRKLSALNEVLNEFGRLPKD